MVSTAKKTSQQLASDVDKLKKQKLEKEQAAQKSIAEIDKKIEQATAAKEKARAEEQQIEREALLSESFAELKELPQQLNEAAAAYNALMAKIRALTLTTKTKRSHSGWSGELNISDASLCIGKRLPVAFISKDSTQVFFMPRGTSNIYGCDGRLVTALGDAVAEGDVAKVRELMS